MAVGPTVSGMKGWDGRGWHVRGAEGVVFGWEIIAYDEGENVGCGWRGPPEQAFFLLKK